MKLVWLVFLAALAIGCNSSGGKQTFQAAASEQEALYKKYHLDKIKLPPGFTISVYAEVPNARSMALSPTGILYVGNRAGDKVFAVTNHNKDGKADTLYTLAKNLESPNGVAFKDGSLYIATITSILKLQNIEGQLGNPPAPIVVYNQFPNEAQHGWKFIAFGPDGKLYVPIGAPCNICMGDKKLFSTISRMNDDGSGFEIFAEGIRNSVGFDWHPGSNELWFTENGRDMMGNDVPADELNHAPSAGLHFGFPYCHEGTVLDPEFGKGTDCSLYTAPVQKLGAHVAAIGMRFYRGNAFGEAYNNQIFIAEHGSWNRTEPLGYRVSTVKLDSLGKSLGYETFAEGWLQPDGKVLGRPADVQQLPDGSLLVSDDYAGAIYKITKLVEQ